MLIRFELPTRTLDEDNFVPDSRVNRGIPTDVLETDEATIVYSELPGVKKDQVQITVEEDVLKISGTMGSRDDSDDSRYILREHSPKDFERHIILSHPVDTKRMSASLKDGLLRVELPKAEIARPKTIDIR